MKQLTIRLSEELEEAVREVARREGLSLNRAAIRLLRSGAGLSHDQGNRVGDSLEHLKGDMTEYEEREILEAVSSLCESIDPSLFS
ncbi:MAG: hypothetical protein AMXMBFR33_46800 [Candidatus Xenobia bacterium]